MDELPIQRLPVDISPPPKEPWMAEGACRIAGANPDDFIPDLSNRNYDPTPALAFCARCDVTAECLAYGRRNNERGVWGGQYLRPLRKYTRKKAA